MDAVGLDTVYNIEMCITMTQKTRRISRPMPLCKKIKKGELGVKTGKGFYTYPIPSFSRRFFGSKKIGLLSLWGTGITCLEGACE